MTTVLPDRLPTLGYSPTNPYLADYRPSTQPTQAGYPANYPSHPPALPLPSQAQPPSHIQPIYNPLANYILYPTLIGQGKFGQVYLAIDLRTSRLVAIKVINQYSPNIDPEIKILRLISEGGCRPNLVCFRDSFVYEGKYYIVTDYIDGMTLKKFIKRNILPLSIKVELIKQIANGVRELHLLGVAHRDLKPENIMVKSTTINHQNLDGSISQTQQVSITIIDFGFSCDVYPEAGIPCPRKVLGTPMFMSGEAFDETYIDPRATDVFAMAPVIYYILSGGDFLFESENLTEAYHRVKYQRFQLHFQPDPMMLNMLYQLTNPEANRPDIFQLIELIKDWEEDLLVREIGKTLVNLSEGEITEELNQTDMNNWLQMI